MELDEARRRRVMMRKGMILVVSAALLLFLSGCNFVFSEEVLQKDVVVEKGDAKQLRVDVTIGAGELHVSGGAEDWVNGDIRYSDPKLEPMVESDQEGGKIRVKQSSVNFAFAKDATNNWDLQLTDEVPVDLNVSAGASKTTLDLTGMQLSSVDIDSGVGELTVDLQGDWKESFDVNLDSGVGQTTFLLPSDIGVKINAESGIGSTQFNGFLSKGDGTYVNQAYETSDIVITIDADVGVGETVFKEK